jgi:hypothetical protein
MEAEEMEMVVVMIKMVKTAAAADGISEGTLVHK